MGVSIEQWRMRIGTFEHPPSRTGVRGHFDVNGNTVCLAVRLALISLLLLSGDIESNPGPNQSSQQSSEKRRTRQTTLFSSNPAANNESVELGDVMQELRNMKLDLGRKMDRMANELNKKIDSLVEDIQDVKQELLEAREETARLTEENKNLNDQVNDLTNDLDSLRGQMKRDNLLFKGISQDDDETWDQSESKVKSFITDKLGLNGDNIEVDRVHRLSSSRVRPQPILAKFARYQQRKQVYEAAKVLKDTDSR
ncbi:uncharacterized protein [Ptychodera flava]|uniref:uncharacterized protein n=1 Tax=Ptychodera flava TaxID=63121 RepID=UPI003969FAA2